MKKVLLLLSVVTFILFTSCKKDAKVEEPSSLAIDLQNGYWETHFTSGAIIVLKFNTSTVTSNWIEGNPLCITDTYTQNYTLDGNILKLENNGDVPHTVEIQDNILTIDGDGFLTTYERQPTLDYPKC